MTRKRRLHVGLGVLAVSGLLAATASAIVYQWTNQTSGTSNDLKGVYFADACNGWIAKEPSNSSSPSQILRTTNGGTNWNPVNTGLTGVTLNRVFAIGNTVWIVGENSADSSSVPKGSAGTILKSTDGGLTWTNQTNNVKGNLPAVAFQDYEGVVFTDAQRGYIAASFYSSGSGPAGGAVLRTDNGGANWTSLAILKPSDGVADVWFVDNKTGWYVTNNGRVDFTMNGGSTWKNQLKTNGVSLDRIRFWDKLHGVVVGESGNAWWTSNGGGTWTPASTGITTDINDIAFADVSTVYIAVENSSHHQILRSLNGGMTYSQQNVQSTNNSMVGITAVGGGAWAVGVDGDIVNTTNPC